MLLEGVQVAHAVLDELRPDQLTRCVPCVPVGREDAVAQKRLPVIVEGLALAEITELGGQDGLDVLGVRGQDHALAGGARFDGEAAVAVFPEDVAPAFEVVVVQAVVDCAHDHVEVWEGG